MGPQGLARGGVAKRDISAVRARNGGPLPAFRRRSNLPVRVHQRGMTKRSSIMQQTIALLAASAIALAPAVALAAPGSSQGSTNGTGWNHLNGPAVGSTG